MSHIFKIMPKSEWQLHADIKNSKVILEALFSQYFLFLSVDIAYDCSCNSQTYITTCYQWGIDYLRN